MKAQHWAILLVLLALAVWLLSLFLRKRTGLPQGEVFYADSRYWQKPAKALYDASLGLVGKPDYLVRGENGALIPVELKSSNAPQQPWDSHTIQLAAYCCLVEKNYGVRPQYGLIQYQDRSFKIPYTQALESELIDLIGQMRQCEHDCRASVPPARSHNSPARCRGCGFNRVCDQRL